VMLNVKSLSSPILSVQFEWPHWWRNLISRKNFFTCERIQSIATHSTPIEVPTQLFAAQLLTRHRCTSTELVSGRGDAMEKKTTTTIAVPSNRQKPYPTCLQFS